MNTCNFLFVSTFFDILLLNTVYMHSLNKTVNTLCVLYLVTCCSLGLTVSKGQSYTTKLRSEWGAVVLNDWCIERISNKKCLHEP